MDIKSIKVNFIFHIPNTDKTEQLSTLFLTVFNQGHLRIFLYNRNLNSIQTKITYLLSFSLKIVEQKRALFNHNPVCKSP